VNPGLKYTLGRIGLFVLCAVPALLLFPESMNSLLKLMIALVVSAALSFFLLRGWRDEVAEQLRGSARLRGEQKERLRSALAGDDAPEAREVSDPEATDQD
jgi:hypothetical protein